MALLPYQFAYNGLTWGPGCDVQLLGSDGLRGIPPLRRGDIPNPRANGSQAGLDFFDERIFTVDLQVFGAGTATPFATILTTVTNAFQMVTDPTMQLPLSLMQPGWASARQITCRPTRGGFPINPELSYSKVKIPVEFTANDPLLYDTILQTVSAGLPSPTAGARFPITFNTTFGASTGGSMNVTNSGNYSTAPIITITGPVTNPKITLGSFFLGVNLSLANGDSLVIDMGANTITLNGTASRANTIMTGSTWFQIPPGTSSIGVQSTDSASVTALFTAAWRSAWGWA